MFFFQLPGRNLSDYVDAQFVFKNNSADFAGSVLYGGAINNCKVTSLESHSSGKLFDMLVHIEDDDTNSSISSLPFIIIIIIIIALQHSEDLDRVNEEQKLVLNEDES